MTSSFEVKNPPDELATASSSVIAIDNVITNTTSYHRITWILVRDSEWAFVPQNQNAYVFYLQLLSATVIIETDKHQIY
jgi:hypothetical protein